MSVIDGVKRFFGAGDRGSNASPDRVIACQAVAPTERHIHATLAGVCGSAGRYVPAALVVQKAHAVSDGVMAALEGASTNGDDGHPGVVRWLEDLERDLARKVTEPATEQAPYAASLERIRAALDIARTGTTSRDVAQDVLAQPLRSRPLGLYAWNEDLARAFVRDRFLQEPLPALEERALATVLAQSAALRDPYDRHLHRVARLTDHLMWPGVGASVVDKPNAIFPVSQGIDNLHGGGASFRDAVKSGLCDLTPEPQSGWYRHQLFALTALLLPQRTAEARRRIIDSAYAEALEQLAAVGHFFARETHVKQVALLLEVAAPTRQGRTVFPNLSVEPVPTFYRLTGSAFRFLRGVVVQGWGEASLGLPQVRATGPVTQTVADGIDEMIAICDSAADVSSWELEGRGDDPRCDALRARLRKLSSDEDAVGDARGMVPIATDLSGGVVRAMVFLGWELHSLKVRLTRLKGAGKDVVFGTEVYPLPVPVVREVLIAPEALADRRAFRAVCDRLIAEPSPTP